MELVCPACGQAVSPGDKFCRSCGTALTSSQRAERVNDLAERIRTSRGTREGERKQITVLFAGMKGSMEFVAQSDPEEARKILDPLLALMMEAVHCYDGTVNQVMGDGIMALFGAPVAREDHAVRACYAALRMQQSLKRHAEESGVPVQIRIGLNAGMVIVRGIESGLHMEYTAVGETVHLAARMEQMARPNTILITGNVLRLVEGYVEVKSLEPTVVKGLTTPVELHEVIGTGPVQRRMEASVRRGLSPFVGRTTEMDVLRGALEKARGGQGEVVAIVGDAGIGKSRLLHEFRRTLGGAEISYLEGFCVAYASSAPFLPLLQVLRATCRIAESDGPGAIEDKVRRRLDWLGIDAADSLPYLLQLLGVKEGTERLRMLAPEAIHAHTFDVLRRMSINGSRRRPLILVLEDLHWVDDASARYLASLVEILPGAPILLIVTHRPGYRQPWMDRSYMTRVALRPLSSEDGMKVLNAVVRERLSESLTRRILDKAEGNALFLEELGRVMRQDDDLRPATPIPDTVQDVLMARIDGLAEEPKRLLQAAAVLGRQFALRVIEAIWDGPGEPMAHLRELTQAEFLYEYTDEAGSIFVFRHSLTQEVAYASLSIARRRAVHTAAGRALEQLYADHLWDVYDRLAYHYSQADDAAMAVKYLTICAASAAHRYAHAEAVTAAKAALAHAERLPPDQQARCILGLVLAQAQSLFLLGRFPDTLSVLRKHEPRLQHTSEASWAGRYYALLANTYAFLGENEAASHTAQQSLQAAMQSGDLATMGKAHYVLAMMSFSSGQAENGIAFAREAIARLGAARESRWLGQAHWALATNYVIIGSFEDAIAACRRAEGIGAAIEDPRLQKSVAWTLGYIYAMLGDADKAIAACRQSLEGSPNPLNTALALGFLGYAELAKRDADAAIGHLEDAVSRMSQFRLRQNHGWFMTFLGEAYLLQGYRDRARELAGRGLQLTKDAGFLFGVGYGERALGRVATAQGASVEAHEHLQAASRTFESIGARFELARTHLDLAALARRAGNRDTLHRHVRAAAALFAELQLPTLANHAA